MSKFLAEAIDSGSTCGMGHPIKLISEGYGYCYDKLRDVSFIWRFSQPRTSSAFTGATFWMPYLFVNGQRAWVSSLYVTKGLRPDVVVQVALADMDAHRALPFDEEAERARLMPV